MSTLTTPDPDEQVRRLLADARHTDPIPDDVAARLNRVVVGLQSDRAADELDARRRRTRRLRTLLVAAAAVAVVTVGATHLDDLTPGGGEGLSSTAGGSAAQEDTDAGAAPSDSAADGAEAALPGRVRLTSVRFTQQVRAVVDSSRVAALAAEPSPGVGQLDQRNVRGDRCGSPGRGARVAATYDGKRAELVIRPVRDGVRRVDLYRCGDATPVRTVRLPAH